jgi:hypothetical protein
VHSFIEQQSIPGYQVRRLEAVKTTLEWVRDNEAEVPSLGSGGIG